MTSQADAKKTGVNNYLQKPESNWLLRYSRQMLFIEGCKKCYDINYKAKEVVTKNEDGTFTLHFTYCSEACVTFNKQLNHVSWDRSRKRKASDEAAATVSSMPLLIHNSHKCCFRKQSSSVRGQSELLQLMGRLLRLLLLLLLLLHPASNSNCHVKGWCQSPPFPLPLPHFPISRGHFVANKLLTAITQTYNQ